MSDGWLFLVSMVCVQLGLIFVVRAVDSVGNDVRSILEELRKRQDVYLNVNLDTKKVADDVAKHMEGKESEDGE